LLAQLSCSAEPPWEKVVAEKHHTVGFAAGVSISFFVPLHANQVCSLDQPLQLMVAVFGTDL
jgi:hypothetical protein